MLEEKAKKRKWERNRRRGNKISGEDEPEKKRK
jgi:hypothetical protein